MGRGTEDKCPAPSALSLESELPASRAPSSVLSHGPPDTSPDVLPQSQSSLPTPGDLPHHTAAFGPGLGPLSQL